MNELENSILRDFKFYPANEWQAAAHEAVRAAGRDFALMLAQTAPDCRELSLAITKAEEAVMWANAAIARPNNGVSWSGGFQRSEP
jgi:hypothetical protein